MTGTDTKDLPFTNLTRPVADLLLGSGQSENVLRQIMTLHDQWTETRTGYGGSPEWAVFTPAAAITMRLGARHLIRAKLRFHSRSDTMGPDEMTGDTLYVDAVDLPDTAIRGMAGSRMADIVDGRRLHHILDDARILRAWRHGCGIRFRLDVAQATLRLSDLRTTSSTIAA